MKRVLLGALALLAGAILADPAAAEEKVDCDNANTQSDMNICADRDYEEADAALNVAYRALMKRAEAVDGSLADEAGAVDALKKAQRAWISYRDGQCALAGFEARGGSMEPMLVSSCLADLSRKRTDELNEALKDE